MASNRRFFVTIVGCWIASAVLAGVLVWLVITGRPLPARAKQGAAVTEQQQPLPDRAKDKTRPTTKKSVDLDKLTKTVLAIAQRQEAEKTEARSAAFQFVVRGLFGVRPIGIGNDNTGQWPVTPGGDDSEEWTVSGNIQRDPDTVQSFEVILRKTDDGGFALVRWTLDGQLQ